MSQPPLETYEPPDFGNAYRCCWNAKANRQRKDGLYDFSEWKSRLVGSLDED